MNDHTSNVQDGQNHHAPGRRVALTAMPIGDAIAASEIAVSAVEGLTTTSGGKVYALIVRGPKQASDEIAETMILLRISDAATVVAMLISAAQRIGDVIAFATLLGAAIEREGRDGAPPDAVGKLYDKEAALDVLAGLVPAQPDGEH